MSKVTVPLSMRYNVGEPLPVEGQVVGVIDGSVSRRRVTVLVERDEVSSTEGAPSAESEATESVEVAELGYRELQSLAKEYDVKGNLPMDELRAELAEVINNG